MAPRKNHSKPVLIHERKIGLGLEPRNWSGPVSFFFDLGEQKSIAPTINQKKTWVRNRLKILIVYMDNNARSEPLDC